MGENAIIIVEISVDKMLARQRAEEVTAWLLESGLVVVNSSTEPYPLWSGPMAEQVVAEPGRDAVNGGVKVICDWVIHHPAENFTAPDCPVCEVRAEEQEYVVLAEQWCQEHQEPLLACPSCDTASLLGDWVGRFALHVGELAVSFHDWPLLSDDFLADLGQRLGPRSRVIYQHW